MLKAKVFSVRGCGLYALDFSLGYQDTIIILPRANNPSSLIDP
jgi:hypothetical protein